MYNENGGVPVRSTFIIDKDGIIRYRKIHERPTLPEPDEILAELKKLG